MINTYSSRKFESYKQNSGLMSKAHILVFSILSISLKVIQLKAFNYSNASLHESIENRSILNSTVECVQSINNLLHYYCQHNGTCGFVLIRFNGTHDQEKIACVCLQGYEGNRCEIDVTFLERRKSLRIADASLLAICLTLLLAVLLAVTYVCIKHNPLNVKCTCKTNNSENISLCGLRILNSSFNAYHRSNSKDSRVTRLNFLMHERGVLQEREAFLRGNKYNQDNCH
jgi:hypothetical protein